MCSWSGRGSTHAQFSRHKVPRATSMPDRSPAAGLGPRSTKAGSDGVEGHREAVTGAEGEHRLGLDAGAGGELEAERLGDHGDDQGHLHHGELLADALVRPAQEREPGEPGSAGGALGQ